jgi:hypothetical protein
MRIGVIFILSLMSIPSFAQKETSHWFFGNGCYLHFSDTGLVVDSVDFFSFESSSSIAKANGDLLLYSNNWNFYDSNGDSIGKTPFGHTSASQGLVFLKSPTTNKVPFLSTESLEKESPIRVAYGNVNLASNKVEDVKVILDNGTEKVCAVNHRNNRFVWVASYVAYSDSLASFLFLSDSLLCCPIFSNCMNSTKSDDQFSKVGQIKFSPNGHYLGRQIASSRISNTILLMLSYGPSLL